MTVPPIPQTASRALSGFCHSISWSGLPDAVRQRVKELVLDHLGVTARGAGEASSLSVAAFAREMAATGRSTVIGGGYQTTAAWAALANGTAAHAIEMDDVTTESSLHPGVVVIPAALAVAEERACSPTAFLESIVAGYEVTIRAGNALNPASAYGRGFHPTGVAGVFGAAIAAGRLLGLDTAKLTLALGIAETMASGSLAYLQDGAWTKRLNAGWAAHAGIVAAGLAGAGFTGPAGALEGTLGLLDAYTDAPYRERLLAGLGDCYQITSVSIKPYACCRYNHGLIDCVLALRRENVVRLEQVERMHLGVLSGGALLVADPIEQKRAPQSIVDAQFSAPFAAALALVRGAAGVEQYSIENLRDTAIRDLMARSLCYRDPSLDAVYPQRWPAEVKIELTDGRVLSRRIEHALGEPENPVPRDVLIAKFKSLTAGLLAAAEADQSAKRILNMEYEKDLRGIMTPYGAVYRHEPPS